MMSLRNANRWVIAVAIMAMASLAADGAQARSRLPEQKVFNVSLTPEQVIPPSGDPDGSGTMTATLTRAGGQFCYELLVRKVRSVSAVKLHVGEARSADIAVAELVVPDAEGKANGCVALAARLVKHILMVPELYYVAVYNADYPRGALRGQLAPNRPD